MTVEEKLDHIVSMLAVIAERQQLKEWYATDEVAALVGKAEFTVRSWCRLGRIRARKKDSGRGAHTAWAISHEELQRYRREGLLPVS
jgi:predicted site-specific integrase-resolvase